MENQSLFNSWLFWQPNVILLLLLWVSSYGKRSNLNFFLFFFLWVGHTGCGEGTAVGARLVHFGSKFSSSCSLSCHLSVWVHRFIVHPQPAISHVSPSFLSLSHLPSLTLVALGQSRSQSWCSWDAQDQQLPPLHFGLLSQTEGEVGSKAELPTGLAKSSLFFIWFCTKASLSDRQI